MSKRAQRRQAEADRAASFADARNLALEIAGNIPAGFVHPGEAGVVLDPAEKIRRVIWMEMRVRMTNNTWSVPALKMQLCLTDMRLLMRQANGALDSIYWNRAIAFMPNLTTGHVVFDFGNGAMTCFSGPATAVLAVEGIYVLYRREGLETHPALDPIRNRQPLRTT